MNGRDDEYTAVRLFCSPTCEQVRPADHRTPTTPAPIRFCDSFYAWCRKSSLRYRPERI